MTLREIADRLDIRVFCGEERLETTVNGGYVSDLLSDVMGNASEGEIWITMQSHLNVVAIASLKELAAVIIVNGIQPADAVISKAEKEGVVLLGTADDAFSITGKIYNYLKQ